MKVIVVLNQDDMILGVAANEAAAERIEDRYLEHHTRSHHCTFRDEFEVEE